jgi:hypothetical protein
MQKMSDLDHVRRVGQVLYYIELEHLEINFLPPS